MHAVEVEWADGQPESHVTVANGQLVGVEGVGCDASLEGPRVRLHAVDRPRVRLLVHRSTEDSAKTEDEPIVTVRSAHGTFSFLAADVTDAFPVYVPSAQAAVFPAGSAWTYASWTAHLAQAPLQTKLTRIEGQPETTYADAARRSQDFPCETILGLTRDHRLFAVDPDLERLTPNHSIRFRPRQLRIPIGRGSGPRTVVRRRLEDGVLPILHGTKVDDEITYDVCTFATLLSSELVEANVAGTHYLIAENGLAMEHEGEHERARRAAERELLENPPEELVLVYRLSVTNTSAIPRHAFLYAPTLSVDGVNATVELEQSGALTSAGAVVAEMRLEGRPWPSAQIAIALEPGETKVAEYRVPHAPRPAEAHCDLFNRDFDTLHAEASAYWNRKLATAATISLPEQRVDEVARAGLLHLDMITYGQREGTLGPAVGSYSPIGTESAPIIQYFDSMGWHDVARRCIQYFLEKQHDNGFMQNFFDYMPETGAVLWTMGEHYLYTRDDAWARDVERSVKKACEWIVERRHADSPEGVGRGMIVGKVADPVDEYRSFMLNSYQYMGLTAAAVLLQNVDPEAAERYAEEAGRFGADIRRALELARERSPVVPLGDGRYVPSSPPWAEGTGFNAFGYDGNSAYSHETVYVKDSLLGPLYAAFAGVIPPAGPLAGEMLEAHHEHMTQEGIALSQPYYSCHPFLNLRRGETKAFLGAFYTGLASIADRETYTFWEHHFGVSTHKTHEEGWFLLQLRQMLYVETADELRLMSAIPRTYLESGKRVRLDGVRSHFGPLFVTVESRTDSGRIDATVSCPEGTARGLRRVTLRLAHPDGRRPREAVGGDYDAATETISFDGAEADVTLLFD